MQAGAFAALARLLQQAGLDIVTYSGYTYEELLEKAAADKDIEALLAASDILIDGPYVREQRDISLAFRGSANQRVIDLAKTRQTGKVVLSELHFR
jgi:anaerobic ribonucleoside-triphosphate reductase activating protein